MRTASIFFVSACVLFSPIGSAQWVQTIGPNNKAVVALAVNGSNVFVATSGSGISRSTDNGSSWAQVNSAEIYDEVECLVIMEGDIFAGTWQKVFRSTDNGTSWIDASTGLPPYTFLLSFAVSNSNLFLGTSQGVFLSTNKGGSWTAVNEGLGNNGVYDYVYALAVSGTALYAGTYGGGVFRTTNSGTSWIPVNAGLENKNVQSLVTSGGNLLAGTNGGGVFRSTDSGTSWSPVIGGLTNLSIRCLVVSGSNIFAGTHDGGVFLSTNQGTNWTPAGLTNQDVRSLAANGTRVFAGTLSGVFYSGNNGANWTAAKTGWGFRVYVLAVSGSYLFAGAESGSIYRSSNGGASWTDVSPGGTSTGVTSLAVNGSSVFAGAFGVGVFRSMDYGTSWSEANTGLSNKQVNALAFRQGVLFAATDGKGEVFVSSNDGSSWSKAACRYKLYWPIYCLGVGPTLLFAGGGYGAVNWTRDNADSWYEASPPISTDVVTLVHDGTYLCAGTKGDGVYRSSNNGSNWLWANTGLMGDTKVLSLAVDGMNLFAGTATGGVFHILNNADFGQGFWDNASSGLKNTTIHSLAIMDNNLLAATDDGVWRVAISAIVSSVELTRKELPATFRLLQNYPNPFNPSTTIQYALPKSLVVRLSVFDMLGREVSVPVNERSEAGVHEVKYDASRLSSGVYFYRLQAGDFVSTKKLVVLK
jgi:hypothetical protein